MEENIKTNDSIIKNIWFAVKRNIVLVVVVILLCTAGGLGYSFLKKPNYTATEEVVCTASESNKDNSTIVNNFNVMNAYINTIVDFCDEGVVIDRANFYYITYKNNLATNVDEDGYSIEDFIAEIESPQGDPYNTRDDDAASNEYIIKSNVFISAKVETETTDEYAFSIGYTDPDKSEAEIKAKIYVLAFRREIQTGEGESGGKYFAGVDINITDLGSNGTSSDVSKVKCTVLGFVIGFVIAAAAVYIISITDVSIKSREELEEITGVALLANIDYEGGKK